MNILPECQDEAFEVLRHIKHVCSSITKPPPIWTCTSADRPESRDHFGVNIVIYNALCTVCAQHILLTEFGIRFFCRFGFRRTFDIHSITQACRRPCTLREPFAILSSHVPVSVTTSVCLVES